MLGLNETTGQSWYEPQGSRLPRYFFHHRIGDRMMWDAVGLDLPDLKMAPDPDRAAAVWMDIIAGRIEPAQILVVTDAVGQVLFVTAR